MHYLSIGIRANRETHPFAITGIIAALEPKLNKMVVRKYADARDKSDTLEAIFQMAERCSKKMLEADSFDCSNAFRVPSTINEIAEANINEVAQGHWNNNGDYGNKQGGKHWDKNRTTRVRRTLTRSHGRIRTRSHGTKIRGPSTVTRSPSPKMLALQSLKM